MDTKFYEISLWKDELSNELTEVVTEEGSVIGYYNKKDKYIEKKVAIISSSNLNSKRRAVNPKLTLNVNGSQNLTFTLYSKYFDEDVMDYIDNPIVNQLVNECKIKLQYGDKWYDFILKSISEGTDTNSFDYSCDALYINELSKNGIELEFDTELENNQGTIIELAQKIVEDTDWVISDESEIIRQYVEDPLYVLKVGSEITAYNMLDETEELNLKVNDIIYGFYTCIVNKSPEFQFLYSRSSIDRGDGNPKMGLDDDGIVNYDYDTYDSNAQIKFKNWYISNTTWGDEFPTYIKTGAVDTMYRGKRLVRPTITKYNSVLDQFVTKYEDSDSNPIWNYTETEYLTTDTVVNYVTNPNNFTSNTGWYNDGDEQFLPTFYPELTNSNAMLAVPHIKCSLNPTSETDLTQYIVNTGLTDNRTSFIKTGIPKDAKYVLMARIRTSNNGLANITNNDFVGLVGSYTQIDTKFDIKNTIFNFGKLTSEYEYYFITGDTEPITNKEYYIKEDGKYKKVSPTSFDSTKIYYELKKYYYNIASVTEALTYNELLKDDYGIFIKARKETKWTEDSNTYWIEDLQFFEYKTDSNGKMIIPMTVPEGESKTLYYFYYEGDNEGIEDPEDMRYAYKGYDIPEGYSIVYDYNCAKIRSITESNSNRFNLIQTLCETFECWSEFNIEHNSDGTIKTIESQRYREIFFENEEEFDSFQLPCYYYDLISGKYVETTQYDVTRIYYYKETYDRPAKSIIFKNYIGKNNYAGLKYGINLKSIKRIIDSENIVSKIIVEDIDNEYSDTGYCQISTASDNPIKESFLFNFKHYYTNGLLNYSEVMNDLYIQNDTLGYIGYYKQLHDINANREELLNEISVLSNKITQLEASEYTYEQLLEQIEPLINTALTELKTVELYDGSNYYYVGFNEKNGLMERDPDTDELFELTEEKREIALTNSTVSELASKLYTYIKQRSQYKSYYDIYEQAYTESKAEYTVKTDYIKQIGVRKTVLNKRFYSKYARFIQEGTWSDDSYIDDNLYYFDAVTVLNSSASPEVTYTISALELSCLEGYEGYTFDVGDKTFMEDTEYFGWTYVDDVKTPYHEEIIVTEVSYNLDSPESNTITVTNYKTSFEDLFHRITASVNSLEYNQNSYNTAASAVSSDGSIAAKSLQAAFDENAFKLNNIGLQSVLIDDEGITVTSPNSPNSLLRLINGGLFISTDGGTTWSSAINGSGINASYINAGIIDTTSIRIMKDGWYSFKWDGDGISAYEFTTNSSGNLVSYNSSKFVRYDQYGLYGIRADSQWKPTSINDIEENADFGLTWNGFFLKSSHDNGEVKISRDNDIQVLQDNEERVKIGLIDKENQHYGLKLNNDQGNLTLKTTDDGNLWLSGIISIAAENNISPTVKIGYLSDTKESNSNYHEVIHAGGIVGGESENYFAVYEDGTIRAAGGEFKGAIYATGGKIGNLTIEDVENMEYRVEIVSNQNTTFTIPTEVILTCNVYYGTQLITDNVTYQWKKMNGSEYKDIEGATEKTYTVTIADWGSSITLSYDCSVIITKA